MKHRLAEISIFSDIKKGDLLLISSTSNAKYRGFSESSIYEVESINEGASKKYLDAPSEVFASLYKHDPENLDKDNPWLFASKIPLLESELTSKKIKIHKIIRA